MVGTLAALQLKLFWRATKGSPGKIVALIFGAFYLLGGVVSALAGLAVLRGHSVDLVGSVTTLGFASITLLWPFLTLIVVGLDQTLDAGRFALFPVRARHLLPGLTVASLLSLGGVATILVALGLPLAWSNQALPALLAVVGAVLGVLTCVLLSRALSVVLGAAMAKRRYRDVAGIILAVLMMTAGLSINAITGAIARQGGNLTHSLSEIGSVVSWTPVGWAWALPWSAASGRWGALAGQLVGALALVAGLAWVWERYLDKALCSPLETGGEGGKVSERSLVDRMVPHSAAGAVAARSLRYWRRDPRRMISVVAMLLLPVLMVAPLYLNPAPDGQDFLQSGSILIYPVFGVLLITGMVVASDISYDGSAISTQILAGIRGRDDRLGRLIALAWFLLPVALLNVVVFTFISKRFDLLPALAGACLGAVWAGMAVGTVVSAKWQYAVPPPGGNPFGSGSSGGLVGFLSSMINMLGSGVLALPFVIPALLAGVVAPWWGWVALALALTLGPAMVWFAVRWGGRLMDESWPEILAAVTFTK